MRAILKIECINDNYGMPPELLLYVPMVNDGKQLPKRYWVAEITGTDPKWKYKREFLPYKKDYAEANSKGTRGVYAFYILDEGKLYEVKKPVSQVRHERYFCTVVDGSIKRLEDGEVEKWLKTI